MIISAMTTEVDLDIAEDGADAERLEQLSLALREELLALDVTSVSPRAGGAAPAGTRAIDAQAIGAMVVSLTPALEELGALVSTVVGWLKRGGDAARTVKLNIGGDQLELTGATSELQQQALERWVQAHATSAG
jgi:hypothetical protein